MFPFFGHGSYLHIKKLLICIYIYIPGPSKGCQMVPKGCQFTIIYHPLGFNWHPLEGAAIFPFGISP